MTYSADPTDTVRSYAPLAVRRAAHQLGRAPAWCVRSDSDDFDVEVEGRRYVVRRDGTVDENLAPREEFIGAGDDVVIIPTGARGTLVDVNDEDGMAIVNVAGHAWITVGFATVAHPDSPAAIELGLSELGSGERDLLTDPQAKVVTETYLDLRAQNADVRRFAVDPAHPADEANDDAVRLIVEVGDELGITLIDPDGSTTDLVQA